MGGFVTYSNIDFLRDYNHVLPGSFTLTVAQEQIVTHGLGPMLVSAGPGSGKTECLVARALYLILVEKMHPKSILITTFTRKAARGLKDRLNSRLKMMKVANPKNQYIQDTNLQGIRIGTIHSLAEEILSDARSVEYASSMVIDEIPLKMLLINQTREPWQPKGGPLRQFVKNTFGGSIDFTRQLIQLYHHIIEDQIDLIQLSNSGGSALVSAYNTYRKVMSDDRRLDFSILLELFLREIKSGALDSILNQIQYVLVDEYQDTNPIQEDIYFHLAKQTNICVVGDDDQALYRFRGASVECMVNFDAECISRWEKTPARLNLLDNFRSHPRIVDFYETYMNSHPIINQKGIRLRVSGNPPLGAKGQILGAHPAVSLCCRADAAETDEAIAKIILDMINTGVVEDASQIAILSPSVDETSQTGVGYLASYLEHKGVPVYNPRGKDMTETIEVQHLFGMVSLVIDPKKTYANLLNPKYDKELIDWLDQCRDEANTILATDSVATQYLSDAHKAISAAQDDTSYHLIEDVMIHILNLPMFQNYPKDPTSAWRLASATNWLEAYSMTPGRKNVPAFRSVYVKDGEIALTCRRKFYDMGCRAFFIGRTPEYEDEEEVVAKGHVSIMTIHQSKGLEFDVVFVRGIRTRSKPATAAKMHTYFAQLRTRPVAVNIAETEMRDTDEFRAFYVAFSRAKQVLILHDPVEWKRVTQNRGYIGQSRSLTHGYLKKNPTDTGVI